MLSSTVCFWIIFSESALAVGPSLTYHGRLLKNDGTPVATSVQFKIQVRTPGAEDCLLYEETQTQDLTARAGVFALDINGSLSSRTDGSTTTFGQIFSNRAAMTFTAGRCSSGTTYSPSPNDARVLRVSFNDGSFAGWEDSPPQAINWVAKAIDAQQVSGFAAGSLLRVENGLGPQPASSFTPANFSELIALINGTSLQYTKADGSGFTPTAAIDFNGQRVTDVGSPTTASDAVNKSYSDAYVGGKAVDTTGISALAGGDTGKLLSWDGAKWVASASGSALTGLNASQLTTGTLPVARLPASVLLNGGNTTSAGMNIGTAAGSAYAVNLVTAGTSRLSVDASGNVGIGVSTPAASLDIQRANQSPAVFVQNTTSSGYANYPSINAINYDTGGLGGFPVIAMKTSRGVAGAPIANNAGDILGVIGAYGMGATTWGVLPTSYVSFIATGTGAFTDSSYPSVITLNTTGVGTPMPVERMRIDASGNVGIGTTNPGYTLHVVGTAGLSSGTSWANASDIRLKDIHGDYEYGLNEILKLHPVRYSYKKDNALGLPSDFRKTGFIAQEVQTVIPDAVNVRKDGYLELNVDPIHWAVVNSVKELYQRWFAEKEFVRKQLASKDREIQELRERLDRLEKRFPNESR